MVRSIHAGAVLLGAILLVNGLQTAPHSLESYTFDEFVQKFGREYTKDSEEWKTREQIFQQNLREVIRFQTGPARSWTQGVTKFMDQTHEEFRAVLGYTGLGQRKTSPGQLAKYTVKRHKVDIPLNFTALRADRNLGNLVRDQGSCGSCWAEAAVAVLEGQMETNDKLMQRIASNLKTMYKSDKYPTLSSQTIVSCTENPRHCGGSGGCGGATVELAYDLVKEKGLPLAEEWPYQSGFGGSEHCRESVFAKAQIKIGGYDVLPSNKYDPLIEALVTSGGPIAVSVEASSWSFYSGGIYSDARHGKAGEFEVNHAVTLCAYQKPGGVAGAGSRFPIGSTLTGSSEEGMGYWLIKNSWGPAWGENGFIRIEMKTNEEEHCGWDRKTHDGLACDGDPDTAWVCGTCGILYDSVYPTDIAIVEEQQA